MIDDRYYAFWRNAIVSAIVLAPFAVAGGILIAGAVLRYIER